MAKETLKIDGGFFIAINSPKEELEIMQKLQDKGVKWRSGQNPLEYIPEYASRNLPYIVRIDDKGVLTSGICFGEKPNIIFCADHFLDGGRYKLPDFRLPNFRGKTENSLDKEARERVLEMLVTLKEKLSS